MLSSFDYYGSSLQISQDYNITHLYWLTAVILAGRPSSWSSETYINLLPLREISVEGRQTLAQLRTPGTSRGFHVLIPLLPGQGRGPAQLKGGTVGEREHYYHYVPNIETGGAKEYEAFVDAMNAIIQKASGLRVVGGLSVGGALARSTCSFEISPQMLSPIF